MRELDTVLRRLPGVCGKLPFVTSDGAHEGPAAGLLARLLQNPCLFMGGQTGLCTPLGLWSDGTQTTGSA